MTSQSPEPDHSVFVAAVAAAIRAPSMHNTQPWTFRIRDGALEVWADPQRQLRAADPHGWAVRIACGAAIFNARLAFAVAGRPADVRIRPQPGQPDLLARLAPGQPRPATPREIALHAAINRRHSNRRPFHPEPVPAASRHELVRAAQEEGAWLELLIGPVALTTVSEVIRAADTALHRDEAYAAELAAWRRDTDAEPDGVPADAGGPSPEPYDLLAVRDFGGRPRAPDRDFETDPLVAVLGTTGDTVHDQILAGQALQRVLLTATEHRLAASMLSQPIEVPAAREQLRVGLVRSGSPQMVLRIGYGQPGYPTRRRPVADVLEG
jgi:nitroreductase